ncbi:MAG: thiamine-phosphate kinase [Gammaproteobacteria bacterium]|nr:thiamine-phosphate kinase [Gammaproteobacteria bacterium]
MTDEFALIERIRAQLGGDAPDWLVLGPGDDGAVVRPPAGHDIASSIDSFLADVHFPARADAELIGYRCLMASLSDLAAMAATPAWALVALSLPEGDPGWVTALARGMDEAAATAGVQIAGGNLAAGPLTITVSVQGWAPVGTMLARSGAMPGDAICLSGPVGGAAGALRLVDPAASQPNQLSALERAYWRPQPPFSLASALRDHASSGIDLSDGLLSDLGHVAAASGVSLHLRRAAIPVAQGADLDDALSEGDDYALAFTTGHKPLMARFSVIGEVAAGHGLHLDGKPVNGRGFRHFR